jgi:hypothetical protein
MAWLGLLPRKRATAIMKFQDGRIKYLIGTPEDGPFTSIRSNSLETAEEIAARLWGEHLDTVDWHDEDGSEVWMIIVPKESRSEE